MSQNALDWGKTEQANSARPLNEVTKDIFSKSRYIMSSSVCLMTFFSIGHSMTELLRPTFAHWLLPTPCIFSVLLSTYTKSVFMMECFHLQRILHLYSSFIYLSSIENYNHLEIYIKTIIVWHRLGHFSLSGKARIKL